MSALTKERADLERVKQSLMDLLNALNQDIHCQIVHELFDHEEFQITLAYDLRTPIDEMYVDWTRVPHAQKIRDIASEHQIAEDQLVCIEFKERVLDQDRLTLQMDLYFNSPRLASIFSRYEGSVFTRKDQVYSLNIEVNQGHFQSLHTEQQALSGIFAYFDSLFGAQGQDVGFFLLNADCYITYLNPELAPSQSAQSC